MLWFGNIGTLLEFSITESSVARNFDYLVVGAGIVGACTAWALTTRYPHSKVAIMDKESSCAAHQTGRNSGVIHAGVYYKPGSLKARYCREGLERTIGFCQQYNIPFRQTGKLIVATQENEWDRLGVLFAQCEANDLQPVEFDRQDIVKAEPNIEGTKAIYVRHSGITDYRAITQKMLDLTQQNGAEVFWNAGVESIEESESCVTIKSQGGDVYTTQILVNCAGIYADSLIRKSGISVDFKLLPFRGDYFRLVNKHDNVVSSLIYPVPDPALPFLGVHLTPMIGGYVTVGPNAVLAGGKESYNKWQFSMSDIGDMLAFKGTYSLLAKYAAAGIEELRDAWYTKGYLARVNRYCKHIVLDDLLPYRAGIRAQAVNKDGSLEHDFRFVKSKRCLHVGNAPSPAATSAIPIAEHIVEQINTL